MIKSVIDVDAPRGHVFAVLTGFKDYKEWMPGCVESRVLAESPSRVETEITIRSIKTMTMGLRFEIQPQKVLHFSMIKGSDIRSYSGAWHLMDSPDGQGTVVRGEIDMDAGAMVPKFMVTRMAKKAIEETGQALRERVKVVPMTPGAAPAVRGRVKPRRILHVLRIPEGYRVKLLDETYFFRHQFKP